MFPTVIPRRYFSLPDLLILLLFAGIIYALVIFGREWQSSFRPDVIIDLSPRSLPLYACFSALRGLAAYLLSLGFTLVVGYAAAHSRSAEKVIIPALDILQSIPVLGFLPGLVLGLIALFPRTNTGLELAAILAIFTGQVWNMTFAFYSSLKSVPSDFLEASTVMGLSPWQRLRKLELPYSAVNLAWNSLMSMAGGWFFLTLCESLTLGDQNFRLPGVGAYMAEAVLKGDSRAMILGVLAMVVIIVAMDVFIWRPVLSYVHRFRLEDVAGSPPSEPWVRLLMRDSLVVKSLRALLRRRRRHRFPLSAAIPVLPPLRRHFPVRVTHPLRRWAWQGALWIFLIILGFGLFSACLRLFHLLVALSMGEWLGIAFDTSCTLVRVFGTLVLSSLWAVPMGIWIALSPRRVRWAQPIIQVLASFPAPMLYPLALALLFRARVPFEVGALLLMLLGVQWYVLFNVVAGALRIPQELGYALSLMQARRRTRWAVLYLPSVFPSLVTGWITAAGGAWNASIVAEYVAYHGQTLVAHGLGARISVATEHKDFAQLSACLLVMVLMVIVLNRSLWARVYHLAQTRFRMEL